MSAMSRKQTSGEVCTGWKAAIPRQWQHLFETFGHAPTAAPIVFASMHYLNFRFEAHACRAQAALFASKPEETFLLRVANAFDELANRRSTLPIGKATAAQMP
jgi:hypothetical protein